MVPDDAAGIRPGSACARAPKITSTIRWLVSVFPATTALGYRASTSEPGRVMTSMAEKHPSFNGAAESIRQEKQ